MEPKYPNVKVRLTSIDGNAFSLIGTTAKALKNAGVPADELKQFRDEAMSGDYDNVIQTCMRWAECS